MSLLLDALKKTGAAQQTDAHGQSGSGRLSDLTLEELPERSAPAQAAPSASPQAATPRSTGENLFAAKRAPAPKKFRYNLGIIPTAIIIGLVLGTAGAIYVWIEIQPPKAAEYHAPPPPAMVSNLEASTPRSIPPLVLPGANNPATKLRPRIQYTAPVAERPAGTPKVKRQPATQNEEGIQIQRQQENDGIYTTLTAAYKAYQNGDLSTAAQRYREVLHKEARNRDALLGMAAISQQQGQDETAIQYYRYVLALDPRDPEAQAGMSQLTSGDATVKESRLKLSLNQTPQSAALYFALGNLYTEQSRWGDAQQAYANALKIEPANALFSFNLATSLDHLGRRKLATYYYQQALQLDTTGNAGFDRVQTEQRMKQLQEN